MTNYLLIFCGGGVGSVTRLFFSSQIGKHIGTSFPWGTLAVNLVGALVVGLLIECMAFRWEASDSQRHFLVSGFLGGFTTFSAFSLEMASMWVRGDWVMATAYVLVSVIGTVGLVMVSGHILRTVL